MSTRAAEARRWVVSRKVLLGTILAVLVLLFTEGMVHVCLWALDSLRGLEFAPLEIDSLSDDQRQQIERFANGETRYIVHHPELGWTIAPDAEVEGYASNSMGIRASHEYAASPPPGQFRVAAFGDSFTHGSEVGNAATWQAILEERDARLEVMNFGVGGYGPDQAYLRYQLEGKSVSPHLVLIGMMPENINRVVNRYRPFYMPRTRMPLAKPRFLLEDGSLRLLANPMPDMSDYRQLLADPSPQLRELGEHDHYFETSYQRGPMDFLAITRLWKISWSWLPGHRMNTRLDELYDTESEAYAVLVEVMDRFYREVADDGAIPIALILPARLDIRRARRGDLASYTPLLAALAERGIETIDAIDAFTVGAGASDWRDLVGAHYTAEGNRRVANLLYERLAPKWADSGRVGGDAEDAPEP